MPKMHTCLFIIKMTNTVKLFIANCTPFLVSISCAVSLLSEHLCNQNLLHRGIKAKFITDLDPDQGYLYQQWY